TRTGRSIKLALELSDGIYWEGGLFARDGTGNAMAKTTLLNPAFLLTDLEIHEPAELVPLLELACREAADGLVLVAGSISEKALGLLQLPANQRRLPVMAVKAPTRQGALPDNLADMALLVGGRPLLAATGDRLDSVRAENLGGARRAWADHEYLGLEGGKGEPRAL